MSTGIEQEASAALHRAVDQLDPPPPRLDLDAIRRAARRRKARAAAAAVIAVIVVAAGAVTSGLRLGAASHPVTSGGPATPAASPRHPQPTASTPPGPAPRSQTSGRSTAGTVRRSRRAGALSTRSSAPTWLAGTSRSWKCLR